jgi:hypothetical protein
VNRPSCRIYQYRRDVQPRDLETLLASRLWSASIESLNDPFEFHALRGLASQPEKQAEFKRAGVTCFCRALTNPLLWSHYANAHAGFAIGYDPAHPFFGGDKGIHKRILHDVRYEDVPPSPDFLETYDLAIAAVLTKPTCWAYEQEVRLINDEGNQLADIPSDAIKELILGALMPPARVEEIANKVRSSGRIKVKIAQMQPAKEGYGVRPQWIAT